MPTTNQSSAIKPKRIAALLAGFDMGNPCEAEAMSHGLALRHMAAKHGMRIVDLLELPDVKRAVDEQLQPKRSGSEELQAALQQAASLRQELTDRMRDVRIMADELKKQHKITAELRKELERAKVQAGVTTGNAPVFTHSFGAQSWVFEVAGILGAVVLMVMAAIR